MFESSPKSPPHPFPALAGRKDRLSTWTPLPDISSHRFPEGFPAGHESRIRLKPSPISPKCVIKLVVTSLGTQRPKRLKMHVEVHRRKEKPLSRKASVSLGLTR